MFKVNGRALGESLLSDRYKDLAAEKAVAKSAPQECASTGATEESPDKLQGATDRDC